MTGGRSSRMGRDKALLRVEEIPMAVRVARAMLEAGASETFLVGGDVETLGSLAFRVVPDVAPHEGPLAGIIGALREASEDVVVVTACDMPWIRAEHVRALVDSLHQFDAVISTCDDQVQPLHAAWKRASVNQLQRAFQSGERSPLRATRDMNVSLVNLGAGAWSIDLDTWADVEAMNSRPT